MAKSYYNVIEVLVNICAASDGKLKIFLRHKQNDPYRGYWLLPGSILSNDQTLEESADNTIVTATNFPSIFLIEGKTFSDLDRDPLERIIACTFIGITVKSLTNNPEMKWFDINELPKMAYDHEAIAKENIEELKRQILINHNNILLKLFPNDFTLSELQHFFEYIMGRELDRRNFRKKLIDSKIVIETGEKINTAGRPSKLYIFNKGGNPNE
ncbi:MAG: NUDIX hydrolase [Bacilli bacterium]|nr:NUDIX hydrolase [Bacilli bacterium]